MTFLQIEDNETDRELMRCLVERTKHWKYNEADTLAEGLRLWGKLSPDVVFLDLNFPNRNPKDVYDAMKRMSNSSCVIALSGDDSQKAVENSIKHGATAYLNKKDLAAPEKFHDAIIGFVEDKMFRHAEGDAEDISLLKKLAEAVFYGNGKPSILARLEGQDISLAAIEKKLDNISGRQWLNFASYLVMAILTAMIQIYAIHQGADASKIKPVPALKQGGDE